MRKNKLFLLVVVFTMALAMSVAVAVDRDVTINAGSLTLVSPTLATFAPVTLTGATQTDTLSASGGTITDATGTGSGWTLKIGATQFVNGARALSRGSFKLTSVPGMTLIDSSSSAIADIDVVAANGDVDQVTPITVFTSGTDEGMGSYNIGEHQFTLTLLPKETFVGTYTSTITYTLQATV